MFVIRFRLRRSALAMGGMIAACGLVAAGIFAAQRAARQTGAEPARPAPVILLDAGHGGEDGGAVGVDGIVEKEINLPITLKLNAFLRALGYETQLTRATDASIHDAKASTLRERKTSDIHNRFHMMEALTENDLFVSIHQNQFPSSAAHGTQVFYSKNHPQSAVLAEDIQRSVVALLQPENTRLVKPSGAEIYLLYHAKIPAVLVECGFLSNPSDAALLKTDEYQNKIAYAIACGILEHRQ
ncbi:MAG: N-acetylmuramoyl-L-alanine amidase [Oscillospiraceae bacterium]|jgi:N-acetylmuramoyl-L-alanine amidase|nr:N-acetylmuramoyl-L-alanine amidase [Oscillospiraceae bacterium]